MSDNFHDAVGNRSVKESALQTALKMREDVDSKIKRLCGDLGLRYRIHDQPVPIVNDHPAIQDLVMREIEERKKVGIERYGTPLQPFNGRDALMDIYEESIDRLLYIRQLIYERDNA